MNQSNVAISRRSLITGAVATGMLAAASPSLAFGDEISDKQAEAATALATLNTMQNNLNTASDNYFQALTDVDNAQKAMDDAQVRIDQESERISAYQGKLGTRARSMYRSGSSTFLDVLLGSASFEEFTNNWDVLNQMNENDAELVQQTKDARTELQSAKDEYTAQKQVAEDKLAEAESIKAEAEATVASMQATYDNLSAEVAQLVEEQRKAEEAAAAAAAAAVVQQSAAGATQTGGGDDGGYDGSSDAGASYTDAPSPGGSSVVERAQNYIGRASYVWGACSPGAFDCSGFVSYCLTGQYARLGTTYTFLSWPRASNPQPGDVAVNSGHCGIYIGGGQMIHCATYGVGVIVGPVQSGMVIVRY